MVGKAQELKGRAEEAIGNALGNERLKQKGQIDQAAGIAKQEATQEKRAEVRDINQAAREAKREID